MAEVYVEEFMSPGCVGCPVVKQILKEEVDITVDTTRASQYGIMSVPAIAINGELKFIGVPKKEELKKALQEELSKDE